MKVMLPILGLELMMLAWLVMMPHPVTLSPAQIQAVTAQANANGTQLVSAIKADRGLTATYVVRIKAVQQCVPIRAWFGSDGILLGSSQYADATPCPDVIK